MPTGADLVAPLLGPAASEQVRTLAARARPTTPHRRRSPGPNGPWPSARTAPTSWPRPAVPVLVMVGERRHRHATGRLPGRWPTPLVTRRSSRLPGAGHLTPLEDPAAFAATVRDWIKAQSCDPGHSGRHDRRSVPHPSPLPAFTETGAHSAELQGQALALRGLTKAFDGRTRRRPRHPRRPRRVVLRPGRPERRRQDHDVVDGHRSAATGLRTGLRRRRRRLGGPGHREGPDGGVAGRAEAVRAALRLRAAELSRPIAGPAAGGRGPAGGGAARGPRPPPTPGPNWWPTTRPACARRSRWPRRCCTLRTVLLLDEPLEAVDPVSGQGDPHRADPLHLTVAARSSSPRTSWRWSRSCARTWR